MNICEFHLTYVMHDLLTGNVACTFYYFSWPAEKAENHFVGIQVQS